MRVRNLKDASYAFLILAAAAAPALADAPIPDLPTVNRRLTLAEAQELALANNISLKQSRADADAASAAARSAEAQSKPAISTTTYGLIGDSGSIVASSPGVMPQNYLGAPGRGILDQNLIIMAPLSTGGRLPGQIRAARSSSEAASLSSDQMHLAVRETVAHAYIKTLLARALLRVAQSRLAAEDEQVRTTAEKVKVGRVAPVDLLRERAEQANARQAVLQSENNEGQAAVELNTALGVSQASAVTPSESLETLTLPSIASRSAAEAIELAEARRPALQAAYRQLEAARASARAIRGAYSPQSYALGMADASAAGGAGRAGYTVGVTVSIPLYEGGQRRADADMAQARTDRAAADAQAVRQTIDQEVAAAWLNLQTASQQVEAARAGVDAAQQSYSLAVMRYDAGKSVAAERLDALAALTRAQGDVAAAGAGLADAKVALLGRAGAL